MRIIFTTIFCFFTILMSSQTRGRPWFVGAGFNAVDYKTSVPSDINFSHRALRVSVGRILWRNFNSELALSVNEINNFSNATDLGLEHTALDLGVRYNFRKAIYNRQWKQGPIDPFIGIGAGITWLDDLNDSVVRNNSWNTTIGINYWISTDIALFTQGHYKYSDHQWVDPYFEFNIGIRHTFYFL